MKRSPCLFVADEFARQEGRFRCRMCRQEEDGRLGGVEVAVMSDRLELRRRVRKLREEDE
jgi:hypothetical protein